MDVLDKSWPGMGTGGSPALDFVNTLDWRLRASPVEMLGSFDDFVRWARFAGMLDPGEARGLRDWGKAHPRASAGALARAIAFREAMAAVFQAVYRGQALPRGPLAHLEAACLEALAARTLRPNGGGVAWEWRDAEPGPDRPIRILALEASRILTSDDRERVRQCGDAECGWLFLDTSRNHSRRWCSMQSCGNRNKARSFYRRSTGRP